MQPAQASLLHNNISFTQKTLHMSTHLVDRQV
jgi:hypothetical protein